MTTLPLIQTEQDYQQAVQRLDVLMDLDPTPNSEQDLELEALALLIQAYEAKHYSMPTDEVTALDLIKFKMEQDAISPQEMSQYLGSPSKVSEVLNGKRPLSLTMMKKLHQGFGIPAQLLLA